MSGKIKELNSLLRLYCSNFQNLHWNSVGIDFNDSHKEITTEYQEMLSESVDKTAEILAMLGTNAPNYIESIEVLKASEGKDYLIVDSSKLYTREDIVRISDTMLSDIASLITCVLEDEEINTVANAGIKSEFESMLFRYDFERRFINNRRLNRNL